MLVGFDEFPNAHDGSDPPDDWTLEPPDVWTLEPDDIWRLDDESEGSS